MSFGFFQTIIAENIIPTNQLFAYRETSGDTAQILDLVKHASFIANSNPDSGVIIANKSIQQSHELGDPYSLGMSHYALGYSLKKDKRYDASNKAYKKAIYYLDKTDETNCQGHCNLELSINYRSLGDYDQADKYVLKHLEIFQNMPVYHDAIKEQMRINGLASGYYYLWANCYMQRKLKEGFKFLKKYEALNKEYDRYEANLYNTFGVHYESLGKIDSAILYLKKGLDIAEAQNRPDLTTLFYINLGGNLSDKGHFDEAIIYLNKCVEIAAKIPAFDRLAHAYTLLGNIYREKGDVPNAIENYFLALELSKKFSDRSDEGAINNKIGAFYASIQEYDKAHAYFKEALRLFESINNNDALARVYIKIGAVFNKQKEYALARESLKKASELNKLNDNPVINADIDFEIAEIYKNMNYQTSDLEYAQKMYESALSVYQVDSLQPKIASSYRGLGEVMISLGMPENAIYYLEKAVVITSNLDSKEEWFKAYQLLSYAYEANGEFDLALLNYKNFSGIKDSITNQAVLRDLNEIKEKYESNRKDEVINTMEKQGILKQRQYKTTVLTGSLLILSMVLVGFIIFQRGRSNNKLRQQQALYEERVRISIDLHDEISSTLSSISMVSAFAADKIKQDKTEEASELLEEISSSSIQMGEELNDLIWTLNPRKDNIDELAARLLDYASGIANTKEIQLKYDVDETIKRIPLSIDVRKNLYLIMKEAIHNSVKHSACNQLQIGIHKKGNILQFQIKDDGTGFVDAANNRNGNGMHNMKERADNIHAHLEIDSSPDKGTNITAELLI